jgi:hypothetical protein
MYDNIITAGDDRKIIDAMLDRNRRALIDTARGLSESESRRRLVPSLTTPIYSSSTLLPQNVFGSRDIGLKSTSPIAMATHDAT